MTTKHTPEPWTVIEGQNSPPCPTISDACGKWFANTRTRQQAARIVACVNALRGINPEAVPQMREALTRARQYIAIDAPRSPLVEFIDAALAAATNGPTGDMLSEDCPS